MSQVSAHPDGALQHTAIATERSASISLTSMSPAVATTGQAMTLSGVITNRGTSAITSPVVHVALSSHLLDTLEAVQSWSAGSLEVPLQTVTSGSAPTVESGKQERFTITIPAAQLNYSYGLASLPISFIVTDGSFQSASAIRGTTRTTLALLNETVSSPLQVRIIVPLTLPADPALYGGTGLTRTAAWSRAIGPDSQLQQTINALTNKTVIWAIDPSIFDPPAASNDNLPSATSTTSDTASKLASPSAPDDSFPTRSPRASEWGSQSSSSSNNQSGSASPSTSGSVSTNPSPSSSSSTSPNDGQIDNLVTDLMTRLTNLPNTQTVWWLPYDDPDLTALTTAGVNGTALINRDLAQQLPNDLAAINKERVLWPVGDIYASMLTRLASTWHKTSKTNPVTLLPTRAVPSTDQAALTSLYRVSGTGGTVTYDETLSSTFSSAGRDPGLRAQQLLAQLMAIYQESPGSARSVTLVAPRTDGMTEAAIMQEIDTLSAAPWIHLSNTTATALKTAPTTTLLTKPTPGSAYPRARASPVDDNTLEQLRQARTDLDALNSILVDSADIVDNRRHGLDVVGSARWRAHGSALSTTTSKAVTAMLGKVSVNTSTINFFANSGQVMVTVVNDLNRPVHNITLTLQPRRYQLRIEENIKTIAIEANARTSVRFTIKAVGSGIVPIDAVLTAPYDQSLETDDVPAQLQVNVHPTSSWIMWVLGVVAMLILIVGLHRAVRRGPRTTSPLNLSSQPTSDDAGSASTCTAAAKKQEGTHPDD